MPSCYGKRRRSDSVRFSMCSNKVSANIDPLERPVWHALIGRQASFAIGDERALRFAPDVNLFAAACDDSPECIAALGKLVPPDGNLLLLQVEESPLPPGAAIELTAPCVQMVLDRLVPTAASARIGLLAEADAPEMLALATLTQPGPFFVRTHTLGAFWGVREDGRLIAMAGERMRLDGFTEISGVCTHPNFRGRGLAAVLSHTVARHIVARGETPFLHALAGNAAAIAIYRALGFVMRRQMTIGDLTIVIAYKVLGFA